MAQWAQIIEGSQVVDGVSFSQQVGFQAKAVGIDNYTPYYIYLKDADSWIAPYWAGAIRVLIHTTDWAYVSVSSPFGAQGVPAGVSSFIHLVWTDNPNVQQTPGASIGGSSAAVGVFGEPFNKELLTTILDVPVTGNPALMIPASILAFRRGLMLQSAILNDQIIYVGGSLVTADESATGGAQMTPGSSFPIDSSLAIPYVITPADRVDTTPQRIIIIEAA